MASASSGESGSSRHLLSEDEERRGERRRVVGAVDGRLVDERRLVVHRQQLPLLLVVADVWVEAESEQRDHLQRGAPR